jgi:NAD(P)-dependent dehydrogenase (short-subunit alcohol dehydrogenase family)
VVQFKGAAMQERFTNKVALVTGGCSGLGRVTANLFSQEGAKVVIADISNSGDEVVSEINRAGGEALFIRANVTKLAEVENMVKSAVDRYGKLDILYNNAATWVEQPLLADIAEADFDKVMNVNAKGVFLGMKFGIQQMLKQGGGVIVNCGSINCFVSEIRSADYAATKAAVLSLTRSGALEYAKQNIRVNCVCPGPMLTPMVRAAADEAKQTIQEFSKQWNIPMGRIADPIEVARAVLFLASEDASFVTGTSLLVDGGYTII